MQCGIDHLVVVAKNLDTGVQWCEDTLGVTPAPGGEHAQFGTHNRLIKIATPTHPLAYLEIIAVNPQARARTMSAAASRWFDMDDPALQAAIAQAPRLVHFVAHTSGIVGARAALLAQGIERGAPLPCSRQASAGLLQWQITLREDGQRLFQGALPSLIQWGAPGSTDPLRLHPRNSLARSGVALKGLTVTHPLADRLRAAYAAIGLHGIPVHDGPANLRATLNTPKGPVVLDSLGI